MNRADQAPDQSTQELISSIRHLFSDDDRSGPSDKSAGKTQRAAPAPKPLATPIDSLPEDDVLELTDELVFPEEQAPPAMAHRPAANPAPALAVEKETLAEEFPFVSGSLDAASLPPQRVEIPARPANSRVQRPDAAQRPAPAGSRPVWSRSAFAGSPAAAATGAKHEQTSGKPQQKSWAEDIQMPVPDQGPVPLIASEEREARSQAHPAEERRTSKEAEPPAASVPVERVNGTEETTVASLARKLARSAAGAMDATELANARDLDFAQLSDDRKAEVTETFANAIQQESAELGTDALPSLLDEVLRQDFIREAAPLAEPRYEAAQPSAQASDAKAGLALPPARSWQPMGAEEEEAPSHPLPGAVQVKNKVAARQQPMETRMPDQSLAQAEFLGAATSTISSQGARTLEDSVREMLRPLLLEWLNENMPRILENAIREEIATRGLLPRSNE